MANPDKDDEEEKPLDPAMARVQARLQRLMLIAGLTLAAGILAVFVAIIYRLTAADDNLPIATGDPTRLPPLTAGPPSNAEAGMSETLLAVEASIPADARLIASTVAGGRIVLTYDHFGGTIVVVVDPYSLQVVGRLDLKPE